MRHAKGGGALPEIYAHWFDDYQICGDELTCLGVRNHSGWPHPKRELLTPVARIIMPAKGLSRTIENAMKAADPQLLAFVRGSPLHRMMS